MRIFLILTLWTFVGILALLSGGCTPVLAYTDQQAIQTIVGEATGQPFQGMVAVGEVIRARGGIRGLYGYKAMFKRHEPSKVWKQAALAWEASKTSHLTHGATLFENVKKFGFPKTWDRSKVQRVAVIENHWFYREIR